MINSLIFSEQINSFSSYCDINPSSVFYINGEPYFIDGNGNIYKTNGGYDTSNKTPYIRFNVNENYETTKIFDNVEMHYDINNKVNVSRCWFTTTNQESIESNASNFDNREGTIKLSIPRASSDRFAERMRDKFLICNYEFDMSQSSSKYFSLPYIKTKFRYSYI